MKAGTTIVYDQKILNEENAWSCTWRDLSSDYDWSVTETEVPAGYRTSTNIEDITTVLTNTGTFPVIQPEESKEDTLPQTGQLWWPVPLLLVTGGMCLITGRVLQNREDFH